MSHYFAERPTSPSRPRQLLLRLPGMDIRLEADAGVFGRGGVDRGTRLLLRHAPPPPAAGDIVDLGCGYGPIAIALALQSPAARIWAVDINRRALELVTRNAATAGVTNVTATSPEDVPPRLQPVAIYSNPPVRIGLALLHPLLTDWLRRLAPGGAAHLVVQRHLGSDSLARWLADEGFPTSRTASHAGYRILRVQPRQAVVDDR